MGELRIPTLNANDAGCTLVEWLVPDGQPVRAGQPVVVVETSKAAEELTSESAGFLRTLVPAGTECRFGQLIATLHEAAGDPAAPAPASDPAPGPLVTAAAGELLAVHGLSAAEIATATPGRRVLRREDVAAYLGGGTVPLSPAQQAVGAVVVESHRTVPAAFVAVRVPVDAALAAGRRLGRRHRCLIGLPELLVKAVAAQLADFPRCFATLLDRSTVRVPEAAHVGVTIDTGDGLHVPVLHRAGRLSWPELSTTLMGYRMASMRGGFRAGDLTGGNITVALHNDEDVVAAVPIVHPGQVCAVSLAGTQAVPGLDAGGTLLTERVATIGLAFDHRVVNGGDAVAFLRAVKGLLAAPDRLA
jgi:2-oxoglutarate dehydrogenase E2 component (dihydrolipoamide succinyltransferase)